MAVATVKKSYTFVDETFDDDFLCSACKLPLLNPITHDKCGQTFCRHCVDDTDYKCSVCHCSESDTAGFSPVTQKIFLNLLGKFNVTCLGCQEVFLISEIEQHQSKCVELLLHCSGKEIGCEFCCPEEDDVILHEQTCDFVRSLPVVLPLLKKVQMLEEQLANLKPQFHDGQVKSFFSLPLESCRELDISCGIYSIQVKFTNNDSKLGFYFKFQGSRNNNENLSFYDATVELTLLKSDMVTVFDSEKINSKEDPPFQIILRHETNSFFGFSKFCSMEQLDTIADYDKKVYFMVTLRDVICVYGNAKH